MTTPPPRPIPFLVALLVALAFRQTGALAERPNIVLVMSDDMGFSDIGCYGGEIDTPHLDALAAGGVRFTQFYNTGRCCPTRAALLTGLYSHQAGVGHMMGDDGLPGYRGNLSDRCVTIAEALKPAGYGCYMSGKWHVTRHTGTAGPKFNWPRQRGFDRFYGTIHGAGSFFDPNSLMRDNTHISPYADPEYKPKRYYYTDAISDHAVRFVREHDEKQPDAPLFLYVAYTAAHWPMHALPEDIAKYEGKYDAGYAATRAARLKKLKRLGLIDPSWDPSPIAGNWDGVTNREWEARCMEVYAAMVDNMDQGIGRILDALEETDRLDNTLVLFLQDNGGCAEGLGRRARSNAKWTKRPEKAPLEAMAATDLQTAMIPAKTRDGFPLIMGRGALPGPADTYIAYGLPWANVSNTPFREYKHWVHEGGIATPLIAHWPAATKKKGGFVEEPAHLVDIMATCVDVAGAEYPRKRDEIAITPREGVSLRPLITGEDGFARKSPIFWEHEGNRAVRDGRWKLVAKAGRPWELYDMQADRTERHNLASAEAERVREMEAAYETWSARANVVPWGELQKHRRERRQR